MRLLLYNTMISRSYDPTALLLSSQSMDPNCNVTARPIAQAVEYATPRKAYAPVKTEPQSECLVCRFPSGNEQTIA